MSTKDSQEVPPAFRELWNAAHRIINPQRQERRPGLYSLPVSLRLAADLIEQDPAYSRFLEAAPWQPKPSAWANH